MTKLGAKRGAGLIVMPETFAVMHRETICALADRYRLPAIYPFRYFISSGGLLSHGINTSDLLRGAASSYVDRILRGAKPDELPVQLPTKF
jgi:putative tryptophan/tyrosine transport system substrate-binding protein